ncbi:family 78 glycoside hydrolase catalytic domain [Nocardioides flavescens]|uniref:alpha-L-rhamnosidase n=1 Tax=Nocardioides flavescens TaxID=2691959 RepID=A0A6L7EZD5_9ACTN|nr:family 78 glycoside hydrolase catalytic domain [Nocardioides flavescens]MXG89301.1 family 78 glycoside hydrolase catalytic domain [Nocardioides flavescens]
MRRTARAATAILTPLLMTSAALSLQAGSTPATAAPAGAVQLSLRTDDMVDPLGTGNATPAFSWKISDTAATGLSQTGYELRVASSAATLAQGAGDLWQTSGTGAAQRVTYAGRALTSREKVFWQVRVTLSNGTTSAWSDPATVELGLLAQSDWTGDWITDPAWQSTTNPVTVSVPTTTARYVRLDVSKMGLPVTENNKTEYFVQLAELTVSRSGGDNLAKGATVTASSDLGNYGWKTSYLTDGVLDTNDGGARGWTTWGPQTSNTGGAPHWVTVDLGASKTFDQVTLYPRTDTQSADGRTPSFPADYTLKAGDSTSSLSQIKAVTGQVAPPVPVKPQALPVLARDFQLDTTKTVASARLYAAGVGIFVPSLNGRSVTDNVLEPGYTDYDERVEYSVYDVKDELNAGANALGIELGTGLAWAQSEKGRYAKITSLITPPRALAQLEVRYTDGTVQRVVTDDSWRTEQGATTMAQWYGGEDYDARRAIPGWNEPGTDRSSWDQAAEVATPATGPELIARDAPALKVVDTMEAAAPTTPATGVQVYDLGTNVAGWPELTIDAPKGTSVQIWIGELLSNGRVSQNWATTGTPIYDTFTSDGTPQTWHPKFVYHGMQYLEVRGVTSDVKISGVKARVIRADNDQVGSLDTSDPMIDAVHRLVDRAVQGNMYSVLTDCPDREKLGWMEQNHLVFGTIMRNYDVAAYARSVVQKIADAQLPNGMVPDTAPEYAIFGGGFRDDPNWGSAIVLMPWAMYENYGDIQTLQRFWPTMVKYVDYLDTRASGDLVNYPEGLGDWAEQLSGSARTPINLVANFGYYRAVDGMAKTAAALGKTDAAAAYAAQAQRIRAAFTQAYYNPSTQTVGNGSQASGVLALDIGAVPEAGRQAVFNKVIADIQAKNTHLSVGEIALPSVYRVLSAYGRDDLVHTLTVQTTKPSFGFFVQNGATSLPEYWDDTNGSRNHFMLGAIDEWFSMHLVGIDQAPGSIAFEQLTFTPSVVGGMTHAEGGYETPYGHVESSWQKAADGKLTMQVEVPVGSTAVVNVPLAAGVDAAFVPAYPTGATYTGRSTLPNGTYATFRVGSGSWTFGPGAAPVAPPTTDPGTGTDTGTGTGTGAGDVAAPVATAAPTVSGTPLVGEVLSATTGTWTSGSTTGYAYQWLADGQPLPGATGASLTLPAAAAGTQVSVRVTATAAGRSATSDSSAVQVLAPASLKARAGGTSATGVRLTVKLKAAAPVAVDGTVVVKVAGKRYKVKMRGIRKDAVRLTVRLAPGRHKVKLSYSGSDAVAATTEVVKVTVRR